ncbi:MAG: arylsulfatase, partial [Phycisphaerae bacterium]|nr:arylsulfatase [Phycisphaerae bacterium]
MKPLSVCCAFLSLCLAAAPPLSLAAARPNVILIMTDDQGYGDLSCHGNPVLKTPHMDRLHAQSVRFTDFHVAPMCSPTRGQLMTGRDAMKNGCTAVCQGRSMMRADVPTMANFFADSGYATGHFGKWHLGDSYPHRPQDRGFQETLHHRAWGITSLADYWNNSYFDPVLSRNGVDKKFKGYCTDIFFDQAMRWIDQGVEDGKPFFLYLPTNTPHVPNVVTEKYSKPYRGRHEGKPIPDTFYGMIANIDENLGRLENFLQEKNLRDNTILLFLTDNGTQSSGAQKLFNAGMRDKKTSVFEGGHRVPCFIRWPAGKLKHGRNVDELTHIQDLLPTLIDLCGLKADDPDFDGTSLAGLLRGTTTQLPDRKLVVQYRVSGAKWNPAVVMWKKWRLIGPGRLYNVASDPHQDRNVAEQHPKVAAAMAEHYDAWHAEAAPLFQKPRWIRAGSSAANPMMLYAQDWVGGYCDNRGGLMRATATGYWNVIVEQTGVYQLELRRWPVEANLPLSAGTGNNKTAGARPIAAANIQVGNANYTLDTSPQDTHATFNIRLDSGEAQLATAFLDQQGRTLCSAIYVKLTRLPDSTQVTLTAASERKPARPGPTPPPGKQKPPAPAAAAAVKLAPDDILVADFDGSGYGNWTATGTAFGKTPTDPKGRVAGHQGKRLVDTFLINESDQPTGTLTSPAFPIQRKYIHFLVGGGNTPGKTCVNLVVG